MGRDRLLPSRPQPAVTGNYAAVRRDRTHVCDAERSAGGRRTDPKEWRIRRVRLQRVWKIDVVQAFRPASVWADL